MKGVVVRKIDLVHEDKRRGIWEIMNGELSIKNMKILKVKEDSYLGGHWHVYSEVMHMLKGETKDYKMRNIDTGEQETFHLVEGDTVFRTGRIVHGGTFKKGSIVIDGASESYISADFNDIIDSPSPPIVDKDGFHKIVRRDICHTKTNQDQKENDN